MIIRGLVTGGRRRSPRAADDGTTTMRERAQPEIGAWPIRRSKVSEVAAERLEALIRDGTFLPGTALPSERELARIFEVGRTSIREALYALHRQGLVRLRNGERPEVTTPTPGTLIAELSGAARYFLAQPDGVEHFQEARALFETGIARLAAERATDDDVAKLRAALDANIASCGDFEQFQRTDVAFHYMLAKITGNPIYTAVHEGLVEWLTSQRTVSLRIPGAEDDAIEAHRLIFEGVALRDPDAAGRAMSDHLKGVVAHFRRATQEARAEISPFGPARKARLRNESGSPSRPTAPDSESQGDRRA
jgi:GntR family transcriptional repressor for pyruvate dehydrogenase complex